MYNSNIVTTLKWVKVELLKYTVLKSYSHEVLKLIWDTYSITKQIHVDINL